MEYVGVGIQISATLPFIMTEKVLMVMVEVDIGLIPSPLPTIIQVSFVDIWVLYSRS